MYMLGSTGVHMKCDVQLTKGIHYVHNTSSMEVIHVTFGIQKLLVEVEAVSGEEVYGSLDTGMVPTLRFSTACYTSSFPGQDYLLY